MTDSKTETFNQNENLSTHGLCSLTKQYGQYARSHIIPKALTRLSQNGAPLVETSIGTDIKRRYDSWFDSHFVIREGEKILEEIDSPAIEILRKHKMVWSSWDGASRLPIKNQPEYSENINFRAEKFEDNEALQLFFLSLVWRAGASKRSELQYVDLPNDVLEDIRLRVQNKKVGNGRDYPIHLHQITTAGFKHNRTPILEKFAILLPDGTESTRLANRVRLYFDGLVAHVHIFENEPVPEFYIKISLGNGDNGTSMIFGMPFEQSRQFENIKTVIKSTVNSSKKIQRKKKPKRVKKNK